MKIIKKVFLRGSFFLLILCALLFSVLSCSEIEKYNNLGIADFEKSQYDQAIEDFNKAIFIDPNYTDAYNNRGAAYSEKGQYDRAIEDYTKVISIDPNHADAYYSRGFIYYHEGQYDRAIEDVNKAISIDPNHARDAYNLRGIIYMFGLGNNKKACSYWEKACKLEDCKNYEIAKQKGDCK